MRAALILVVLAVAGCELEPYCLVCPDASAGDGSGLDAGRDASPRDAPGADGEGEDAEVDACGTPERCNEVDDDCDGIADEGIETSSSLEHCGGCERPCRPAHAFGACVAGACEIEECDVGHSDLDGDPANGCEYRCLPVASDDAACDFRDDDCDGEVDEDVDFDSDPMNCGRDEVGRGRCGSTCRAPRATGSCVAGACTLGACEDGFVDLNGEALDGCEYRCVAAAPPVETCDLRDDDCDGAIDEGDPGGGAACGSDVGACDGGTLVCTGGTLVCAGEVAPEAETCNALDDDCDGDTDEGNPGGGALCGTDVGRCAPGVQDCSGGAIACVGAIGPTPETCDGSDEDCDGRVDEGDPGGGGTCGSAIGACAAGTLACRGGAIACEGASGPAVETCNTLDDDCDGSADEGFSLATDVSNCGACGIACAFANAIPLCSGGVCGIATCRSGFADADGSPTNGCELACSFAGAEACNGRDDDCDARTDEALSPPASFCNPNGVCAATSATCGGASGWRCTYPATFETTETRCDSLDNDCDGRVDEAYALVGAACANGSGACRRTGTYVCNAAGDGVRCTAPAAGTPADEACNDVDDDCDGAVDERRADDPGTPWRDGIDLAAIATVAMPRPGGGTMRIMQYEASRPDASPAEGGAVETFACSRAGVLPWTNVTWTEANDACCALNADGLCRAGGEVGWRLCPSPEWEAACEGPSSACTWAYTATCSSSRPLACNGREHDCEPGTPGDQDCLYPTGAATFPECAADWGAAGSVHDLSGNAREWTATAQGSGIYELRGGAYTNIESGRRCSFEFAAAGTSFAHPNTGFRCCHY